MQGSKCADEYAVKVLIDSMTTADPDEIVAKRHGITGRTVWAWRQRLETDEAFSKLFNSKLSKSGKSTAEGLSACLDSMIHFLKECAAEFEKTPENAEVITNSLKVVAEVELTRRMVDIKMRERAAALGQGQQQAALAAPVEQVIEATIVEDEDTN